MARHAIERDRTPWPTPRTADFPPPNARSARRAPKARWRVRVICRTLPAIGAGAALLAVAAPELMAWLGAKMAAGLRFDARQLADAQFMPQRLASLGLPALLLVLGRGRAVAGARRWRRACCRAAGTSRSRRCSPSSTRSTRWPASGACSRGEQLRQHAEVLPAGADPGRHRRGLPREEPAALRRGHGPAAAGGAGACRRRGAGRRCCCWCWRWRCSPSSMCRCSATSWPSG